MRFSSLITAASLAILARLSDASSCTSANAIPVENYVGSGSGGGAAIADDMLAGFSDSMDTINSIKRDVRVVLNENFPRQSSKSLTCTDTELCLSIKSIPFCFNPFDGDFHMGDGTVGNLVSGDYTLEDGRRGNLIRGPHPTPTTAGVAAATAPGPGGSGTKHVPQETGAASRVGMKFCGTEISGLLVAAALLHF